MALGEKICQLYGLAEGEIPVVSSPEGKFGTPGSPTAGKIRTTYHKKNHSSIGHLRIDLRAVMDNHRCPLDMNDY